MDSAAAGLAEPLRSRVDQLLAMAAGRVQIGSGRRTTAQQAALRVRNGCPDVYSAPASSCRVPTARPGESKHELGLAVDLTGDLDLAGRLAPLVGLRRTVMPKEPWHFEPVEAGSSTGRDAGNRRGLVGTVAAAGEPGAQDGLVERFVDGLRRLTLTGLVLAGGGALVVIGGYRAVSGQSLTTGVGQLRDDLEQTATKAAIVGATGGAGAAAGAAAASTTSTRSPTKR